MQSPLHHSKHADIDCNFADDSRHDCHFSAEELESTYCGRFSILRICGIKNLVLEFTHHFSVCSVPQIASFVNIIPYLQKCLTYNNNHMRLDLLLWHHLCNLVPNMIHVNGIRCLWELNLVSHTRLEFLWYKCWISYQIITINFDLIRCLDKCLSNFL